MTESGIRNQWQTMRVWLVAAFASVLLAAPMSAIAGDWVLYDDFSGGSLDMEKWFIRDADQNAAQSSIVDGELLMTVTPSNESGRYRVCVNYDNLDTVVGMKADVSVALTTPDDRLNGRLQVFTGSPDNVYYNYITWLERRDDDGGMRNSVYVYFEDSEGVPLVDEDLMNADVDRAPFIATDNATMSLTFGKGYVDMAHGYSYKTRVLTDVYNDPHEVVLACLRTNNYDTGTEGVVTFDNVYLMYDDAEPTMEYFVPYVSFDGSWSGMALSNPSGDGSVDVTLTYYDNNGQVLATESKVLPPNGHTSFVSAGPPGAEGWAHIAASGPLDGLALVGQQGEGLMYDIDMKSQGSLRLLSPHYAISNGWVSTAMLANPNDSAVDAELEYRDDGGAIVATKDITIPAKGAAQVDLSEAEGLEGVTEGAVYVYASRGIVGFLLYDGEAFSDWKAGLSMIPVE